MKTMYTHPNPTLDRLTQYGATALATLMLLAALAQLGLAFSIYPPGIFVLTAVITMLLIPFVLMLTAATPAVTLAREGLAIEPLIWKKRVVSWSAVKAIKPYPLLPQADAESGRKAAQGRKRYRPAEGIMLVIPGLPPQYRIAGWLAGEGWTPIIAVTTRTHQDYDQLVSSIRAQVGAATGES